MSGAPDVAGLLARLDAVEARLEAHAAAGAPDALTDPDPASGERWEAGQVWSHIAEFVPFWHRQTKVVLAAPGGEPAPFGRTKTDEGRLAGIERDRNESPRALMERVTRDLASVRTFVRSLPPEAWDRVGVHPARGEMPLLAIVETFEVKHLEEHADQLEGLAAAST